MKPASYIADHLRTVLRDGGSAPHTEEVQRFFKQEVQSRGWYTGEVRKLARRFTKVLKNDAGLDYLVEVADLLFRGEVLEEKILAVFLLERDVAQFGDREFKLFEALARADQLLGRSRFTRTRLDRAHGSQQRQATKEGAALVEIPGCLASSGLVCCVHPLSPGADELRTRG